MATRLIAEHTFTGDETFGVSLLDLPSADIYVLAVGDFGGGNVRFAAGLDDTTNEIYQLGRMDGDFGIAVIVNAFPGIAAFEFPFDWLGVIVSSSTAPDLDVKLFQAARK